MFWTENYLVPVGDTEFAQDPTFAFTSSDLQGWVEEKTASAGGC